MKLPNRENAFIPPLKLKGYLLSETHSVGKSKAKFLRAVGFDETNVNPFERCLLALAQTEEITEIKSSPHGMKYVIDGAIQTPIGDKVQMRTVWIIESGEDRPRFVTAYPL